jgi:hypothetical protein
MLGRKKLKPQEATNVTRNRDVKEQLRLGNMRTTKGTYRKSTGLEIAKRISRCTVGLKRIMDLVEWSTPSKTEKMAVRGGVRNVKAPASTTTERKKGEFIRVSLGTSAHKEGAVAMIGEWSPQPGKKQQTNKQTNKQTTRGNTVPERKRRRCKHNHRRKKNGNAPLAAWREA